MQRSDVPVLLVIFNRPDKTQQVFQAIRQAKPRRLFVFADGCRVNNLTDIESCHATRQMIQVDWDCELEFKINDKNEGCRLGMHSAVSWFFSHVEEGIILEDDCVPHPMFFDFCQELLNYYRDDSRIFGISGNNFTENRPTDSSYYFLKTMHIWGWATWRRSWRLFDLLASDWPALKASNKINEFLKKKNTADFWSGLLDYLHAAHGETWSTGVIYAILKHDMLGISPKYNLVSNIGFGNTGVNKTPIDHKLSNVPCQALELPLQHPKEIALSVDFDQYVEDVWEDAVRH